MRSATFQTVSRWVGLFASIGGIALMVRIAPAILADPGSYALMLGVVVLNLSLAGLIDFFAGARDRLPLLTWCHALTFGALATLAIQQPTADLVAVATGWGVASLILPIAALFRPHWSGPRGT
jgi:hypothetical protein